LSDLAIRDAVLDRFEDHLVFLDDRDPVGTDYCR
jgi:hypothetical protein